VCWGKSPIRKNPWGGMGKIDKTGLFSLISVSEGGKRKMDEILSSSGRDHYDV